MACRIVYLMTTRRLLNTRFYRQHAKLRARVHRRKFGFVAAVRLNWKRRAKGILAPLIVLIAAVKAARIAARYRARRKIDSPPLEKSPRYLRRPMSVRHTAMMRRKAATRMLERFGYSTDTTAADGMPWIRAKDRRLMRNARKRERAAA